MPKQKNLSKPSFLLSYFTIPSYRKKEDNDNGFVFYKEWNMVWLDLVYTQIGVTYIFTGMCELSVIHNG